MKKYILIAALLVFPVIHITSCIGGPPQQQQVIVRPADLKENVDLTPGPNQQAAPIIVSQIPDKTIREALQKMFPGEDTLILTTKEFVKPATPTIPAVPDDPTTDVDESKPAVPGTAPKLVPITPPTTDDGKVNLLGWLSEALPALSSTIPAGAGPWIAPGLYLLGLLAKKRSRSLLADAVSDLNPLDGGSVDVSSAYVNVKKAVGYEHTNETPEQLRAVADKLEAKAAADKAIEFAKKKEAMNV